MTGVDINPVNIDYTRDESRKKRQDIEYIRANYLELDLPEAKYDMVTMIFTDMGVLLPVERDLMLSRISHWLKKDGLLIFDVLNDHDIEKKTSPKNWEAAEKGFWRTDPYLLLSESFLYRQEKVILYQHVSFCKAAKVCDLD